MINLLYDQDTLPIRPIIFKGGQKSAKLCTNLEVGVIYFRQKAPHLKSKTNSGFYVLPKFGEIRSPMSEKLGLTLAFRVGVILRVQKSQNHQ